MPATKKAPTYPEQSRRLNALYRVAKDKGFVGSQDKLGADARIGNQAFVSQLMLGRRPLNFDTAGKFARAFHVKLSDVSPELAAQLLELASEFLPADGYRVSAVRESLPVGETPVRGARSQYRETSVNLSEGVKLASVGEIDAGQRNAADRQASRIGRRSSSSARGASRSGKKR